MLSEPIQALPVEIPCLFVPMMSRPLLIPNASVAEVVT